MSISERADGRYRLFRFLERFEDFRWDFEELVAFLDDVVGTCGWKADHHVVLG